MIICESASEFNVFQWKYFPASGGTGCQVCLSIMGWVQFLAYKQSN